MTLPECVDDVLLDLGVAAEHHLDELVEVDGAVAVLVDVPARARSHSHSECTVPLTATAAPPSLNHRLTWGQGRKEGRAEPTDEPRRTK